MILSTRKASSPGPIPRHTSQNGYAASQCPPSENHPGRHCSRVTHNLIHQYLGSSFSPTASSQVSPSVVFTNFSRHWDLSVHPASHRLSVPSGERTVRRPDMERDGARRRNSSPRALKNIRPSRVHMPVFSRSSARCSGQAQTDGSRSHDVTEVENAFRFILLPFEAKRRDSSPNFRYCASPQCGQGT